MFDVQHFSHPSRVCLRIQPARLQVLTVLFVLCHCLQLTWLVRERLFWLMTSLTLEIMATMHEKAFPWP